LRPASLPLSFAANGLHPTPLRNGSHEQAYLPALEHPPSPHPRVPRAHEDPERPRRSRPSSCEGALSAVGHVGQQEGLSRLPCAASPTAGRPVPNHGVRRRGHLPPRVRRGGFCRGPSRRDSANALTSSGSSRKAVVGRVGTSRRWSWRRAARRRLRVSGSSSRASWAARSYATASSADFARSSDASLRGSQRATSSCLRDAL